MTDGLKKVTGSITSISGTNTAWVRLDEDAGVPRAQFPLADLKMTKMQFLRSLFHGSANVPVEGLIYEDAQTQRLTPDGARLPAWQPPIMLQPAIRNH